MVSTIERFATGAGDNESALSEPSADDFVPERTALEPLTSNDPKARLAVPYRSASECPCYINV